MSVSVAPAAVSPTVSSLLEHILQDDTTLVPTTMATLVANYAARKVLGGQLEKYKHKNVAGDDDVRSSTLTIT